MREEAAEAVELFEKEMRMGKEEMRRKEKGGSLGAVVVNAGKSCWPVGNKKKTEKKWRLTGVDVAGNCCTLTGEREVCEGSFAYGFF